MGAYTSTIKTDSSMHLEGTKRMRVSVMTPTITNGRWSLAIALSARLMNLMGGARYIVL